MLLKDKKALIFGLANNRSIAYGIAAAYKEHGARLAFSWPGEAIRKRVLPLSEELGGDFTFPCDVSSDEQIAAAVETVQKHWGKVDVLVHAVAFADKEDLGGRFIDTTRAGYAKALDISAFSLGALCKAFEGLLNDHASVITLTYYGADKWIANYNVMGVAKAALQAGVRYLAYDLGGRGIRVNALSAGPLKTLAASGISGFSHLLKHIERYTPLNKNITIEEVGNAALFLASDLSSGMTGEVMFVDAGYNTSGIQIPDAAPN
ncbi:MAG: enoyl-ACP reductase [Deltaproteobacteria bacterium]|jgi:enoyl-[acyl-carrier protein] reductase I|nr:enoyl-ACP reductase [Deltaproteobacteria bacterium]